MITLQLVQQMLFSYVLYTLQRYFVCVCRTDNQLKYYNLPCIIIYKRLTVGIQRIKRLKELNYNLNWLTLLLTFKLKADIIVGNKSLTFYTLKIERNIWNFPLMFCGYVLPTDKYGTSPTCVLHTNSLYFSSNVLCCKY